MYKNYLFDLYGTLMEVRTEDTEFVWEKMALYLSYYGANYDAFELKTKYEKSVAKILNGNDQVEVPELDIQDVFYKLYKDKDVKAKKKMPKDAAKVFRVLTTEYLEVYEGVLDLLAGLKEKNANVFLMANGQSAFVPYELRKCGIKKFIDGCFLSSDFGVCKPDPTFYQGVFNGEDIKKKESIIISADYKDIEMAEKLGVDALYIDDGNGPEGVEPKKGLYVVKGRAYQDALYLLLQ